MIYENIWHSRHNLEYRLRTKFRAKLKRLQQKFPSIKPFTSTEKMLTTNWWGKAWNSHLRTYAPKSNRLDKGRLNFKCEALADLKINHGHINALVLGSKQTPYHVEITITPISNTKWAHIKKKYEGNLGLFEKILDHHPPKEMASVIVHKTTGLLPSLKEITFKCDCPDNVNLCKHTATALYALGTKIDENFNLLFLVRGVNFHDFIHESIKTQHQEILKRIKIKRPNIMSDAEAFNIFGVSNK